MTLYTKSTINITSSGGETVNEWKQKIILIMAVISFAQCIKISVEVFTLVFFRSP